MKKFLLFGHGGCENHGCEAIIRGTVDILKRAFPDAVCTLSKQAADIGIDGTLDLPVDQIVLQNRLKKFSLKYLVAGVQYTLLKSKQAYYSFVYKNLHKFLKNNTVDVAFSVGGDNYCYGMHNSLYYLDAMLADKCKRVLWGCSIEPSSLDDPELVEDLDSLDLIVAREPISTQALQAVLKKAKVVMKPDPAFALKATKKSLPEALQGKKSVGINISPVVSKMTDGVDITFQSYEKAMEHILENTDYNILLIPHVTWDKNNDLEPLGVLYQKYKDSGRVFLVEDFDNCEELKGYIAQCDMFIGARTHSTIAAYSSCVPCVVVGYSVKAEGIAQMLFGTTENYVVDSRTLSNENALIDAFNWLDANKDSIKIHLEEIMPDYIEEAYSAAEAVKALL